KNPDFAARLVARIASRQGDVKIKQQMRPVLKKHIEGRVKEEQAFTRVYRMLAKERQSGLKPPSLLTQFLLQLGALIGPPNNPLYPLPIAVEDKAKAMLLYARKGDTSAHKKVLALIRDRKQEAQAKKEKFSAWVTEMEDSLRADEALLEKTR